MSPPQLPMQRLSAVLLLAAVACFEVFNFDSTRFALRYLLGDVGLPGLNWAVVLAVAFCGIDLAGLLILFTPDGRREVRGAWLLLGAWLLGATLNAALTWFAVGVTLRDHPIGGGALSDAQLYLVVPFVVATLVWGTRVLFIGSLMLMGDRLAVIWPTRSTRPTARPTADPAAPQPAVLRPVRETASPPPPPRMQPRGRPHGGATPDGRPPLEAQRPAEPTVVDGRILGEDAPQPRRSPRR